tara:strand:+ start:1843 stop:2316 length:474 start_codon:yes stop_codon:yes gene_type:complete
MESRQEPQKLNHCSYSSQPIPPFIFRSFDEKKVSSITKQKAKRVTDSEEEKEFLYCTYCLKLITSGDQRIQIGESHEHVFTNPAGITFNIGCFREAPGATFQGIPTGEFTWFKGYQWRMAYCSKCLMHIGWQFHQGSHSGFAGLILTRLTTKKIQNA